MSDPVILARLVLINDHLIELLKWAIENDKPDCAVQLATVITARKLPRHSSGVAAPPYSLERLRHHPRWY